MLKTLRCTISIAALACMLPASSACAALIEFTSRAAFNAATSSQIIEPNAAPPGSYSVVSGQTINGITYPAAPNYTYMVDPAYAPELYEYGTGPILLLQSSTGLSFGPVTAFGADFATLGDIGTDITITIGAESRVLATSPEHTLTFFGFISTSPFTAMGLSTGAQFIVLDNVTRASAATVIPEPHTLALIALALGGLTTACRRRRQGVAI